MITSTNGASTRRPSIGPDFDALCDSVVQLARDLPTPLQRLSLRVGEWAVDVEFAAPAPAGGPPHPVTGAVAAPPPPEGADSGIVVRSELVGTFFSAPAPGADPFVNVGDRVEEGQQLGIVEAMKLMNPVLAPGAGAVTRKHVSDGESVEYDQPLITLEPVESR